MKRAVIFVASFIVGAVTGFVLGAKYGKDHGGYIPKKDSEPTSWSDIKNEDNMEDNTEEEKDFEELCDDAELDSLIDIPPDDDRPDRLPFLVVSEEELWNENPDAANESITYYKRDGIFLDELDEVIDNPEEILGLNTIAYLESDSLIEDLVFVRNDEYDTNYTIEIERDKRYF